MWMLVWGGKVEEWWNFEYNVDSLKMGATIYHIIVLTAGLSSLYNPQRFILMHLWFY